MLLTSSQKDDVRSSRDSGLLGIGDDDLNLVDRIMKSPPGAGYGVDNAGNGGGNPQPQEASRKKKKKTRSRRN